VRPARHRTGKAGIGLALVILGLSLAVAACKRPPGDEFSEPAEPPTKTLPELRLEEDTADLLLTWVDARGDAHIVSKPADVPTEGRDHVRVVVTTRDDGTRDLFYVSNLTVKSQDGTYPVTTMTRVEWEKIITQRRQAFAPPSTPAENAESDDPARAKDPSGKTPPPSSFTVIVYGASWCEACHQAVAYLKKRKVPVVEKDIEQDPAAESEMRTKMARAGVHGGSIPVIDVKGKILVGFEPRALEAAVRGASAVAL
jgi:glutaredoxin